MEDFSAPITLYIFGMILFIIGSTGFILANMRWRARRDDDDSNS